MGGYLDPNHYADYADALADYVLGYRAKMGVDLTALSPQNEPNFRCTYTLTQYRTSATENIANIGTVAGGATVTVTLAGSSVTTFVGLVAP